MIKSNKLKNINSINEFLVKNVHFDEHIKNNKIEEFN